MNGDTFGDLPFVLRQRLSATEKRVLGCIRAYVAQHGWAPSLREIGADVHLSVSQVHVHLHRLAEKGYIRLGGGPRMIAVVE